MIFRFFPFVSFDGSHRKTDGSSEGDAFWKEFVESERRYIRLGHHCFDLVIGNRALWKYVSLTQLATFKVM